MKKYTLIPVLILCAATLLGQTLKKGGVMAIRSYEITLQSEVNSDQFLAFWMDQWNPAHEKAYPGVKVSVIRGDRGEFINRYGEVWTFKSKALRDKYWPSEEGAGPFDEAALEILGPFNEESGKYLVNRESKFTDWVILPNNTSSSKRLQQGNLLGIHVFTPRLEADVSMDQFLDHLAESYIPLFEKYFKGWKVYLMKGDRGENKDEYMWMYWIKSREARDQYFNDEGVTTDAGNEAIEKLQPVYEELQQLATWTSAFTDWLIL